MNRLELLKKMLPGFIPLFVFVAADAIWGTKIGLYVAVAVGFIQLIIDYIRFKKIDKFILLDTALIVALGVVSIIADNAIFVKLKPAFIEFIMAIIVGVSVFTPKNIMLGMSKRYMKGVDFNEQMIKKLNQSMKRLFIILIVHIALTVYSAYFMSNAAWAFISGGLFYIIVAIYAAYEFISQKMKNKNTEYLPVVDEEGKILGKASREECHSNPELMHPVIRLHIFNSRGEILLQQRGFNKSVEPGKWDSAVAGHVLYGEKIEDAVKRETFEEVNLKINKFDFIKKSVLKIDNQTELVLVYFTITDQEPKADEDEVEQIKFCKIEDVKKSKMQITPAFESEYDLLIQLREKVFKR